MSEAEEGDSGEWEEQDDIIDLGESSPAESGNEIWENLSK